MKFGVLQFFSWPGRRTPIETVYERAFDRIEIMDKAGYDCVWLAEHHFNDFSVCPSIHMMGVQAANRTKRLRIGTGVSLAALYHPLRLAEEVALLDVLSGGRVNWGAGRGFHPGEFNAFGVDINESYAMFREHVDAVIAAWREERVTFKGKYVAFEDVEVLPKPLQHPHPPVWLAASSGEAIEWAAERGFSILMDPHSAHAQIKNKFDYYAETLQGSGHSLAGRDTPMARLVVVAPTRNEAKEVARKGAQWTVGSYARKPHERDGKLPSRMVAQQAVDDPVEHYMENVIVYGDADEVEDKLRGLHETMDLNYLIVSPLSHDAFTLFTEKVLPRFQ
jgi:alkanesulfonate monooxygenase SsuD/methylene tetrahydromethanopterin reductase-like flavin-dependent oxidoreductase (luciferase family)